MRTTVDLPDNLFKKAKAVSSLQGVSLKEFIQQAIEHELDAVGVRLDRKRVALPIVRSRRPGSVTPTPERIAVLLDGEDLHVSP